MSSRHHHLMDGMLSAHAHIQTLGVPSCGNTTSAVVVCLDHPPLQLPIKQTAGLQSSLSMRLSIHLKRHSYPHNAGNSRVCRPCQCCSCNHRWHCVHPHACCELLTQLLLYRLCNISDAFLCGKSECPLRFQWQCSCCLD